MKKLLLSFVRRAAIAIMVILACAGISNAQSASLIRVEEDWVGLVGEPDTGISSPQILNVISPNANLNGAFGLVQLNHRGSPDFVAGGQQVQGWIGDTQTSYMSGTKTAQLYRISDNIRYTVAMEKVATGIRFETYGGRSRTWGRFNSTPISVTVQTTDNNLDGYSTAFSTSNTTVNLGAIVLQRCISLRRGFTTVTETSSPISLIASRTRTNSPSKMCQSIRMKRTRRITK